MSHQVSTRVFPFLGPDPINGWWEVDGEGVHGPILFGIQDTMQDEALTERLRQPVSASVSFRVVTGASEWLFEFSPEGLAEAVAVFDPTCST